MPEQDNNNLSLKDNTMSYSMTLCIYGVPCHLLASNSVLRTVFSPQKSLFIQNLYNDLIKIINIKIINIVHSTKVYSAPLTENKKFKKEYKSILGYYTIETTDWPL